MGSAQLAIELTDTQRETLRTVMRRHAGSIRAVGVYGSRVKGRSRVGSDVDIVVYGEIDDRTLAQIHQDIDTSGLSIFWNVTASAAVADGRLKDEIDHWVQPLFNQKDLLAA